MGLVPCLAVTMLAIHNVAGLGAPTPVASLDAKQQEIVDFAVVQLQVSRARGWESLLQEDGSHFCTPLSGWRARAVQEEAQDGEVQSTGRNAI